MTRAKNVFLPDFRKRTSLAKPIPSNFLIRVPFPPSLGSRGAGPGPKRLFLRPISKLEHRQLHRHDQLLESRRLRWKPVRDGQHLHGRLRGYPIHGQLRPQCGQLSRHLLRLPLRRLQPRHQPAHAPERGHLRHFQLGFHAHDHRAIRHRLRHLVFHDHQYQRGLRRRGRAHDLAQHHRQPGTGRDLEGVQRLHRRLYLQHL